MPKEDIHEKLLRLMTSLNNKGMVQIPKDKCFYAITMFFGEDRNKRNYIMQMLIGIGYFKEITSRTIEIKPDIAEKYREDKLFFV